MARYPARPLASDDCARLLAACGPGWIGARNRGLLTVYWRAGLRCAEALALELYDLRRVPGGMMVVVRRPKGIERKRHPSQPREVGLDPKARDLVERWLEVRGNAPGPAFCTRKGGRVHETYVRRLLPKLGRRAGISGRVHCHGLRHSFARELYDEGVGPVELMLALGHTSLETTQRYLVSIGATEVLAVTTGRRW